MSAREALRMHMEDHEMCNVRDCLESPKKEEMCKICAREYDSCWCKDREGVPGAKNLLQKVMCANWRLDIKFEFKSDQKSHASLRTKELLGYVTFSHAGRAILSLQPVCPSDLPRIILFIHSLKYSLFIVLFVLL